jgi:release factor glutamine methyltransferase
LLAEESTTVGGLCGIGTRRLREAGLEDPRREALRIWADYRELTPGAALADQATPVGPDQVEAYERLIGRRAAGEPLAYVTGWTGFRHLTLRSDRRALIPRPETEGLIDLLLERCPGGRVADIGTGTGCLALSLADEGRFEVIVGVDRSAAALELAAQNRRMTGLGVALVRGDLTSPFGRATLDAVVSNPPYLAEREWQVLDPSVRDWEPVAALTSGEDGLEATTQLLADAIRAVRAGGWIALEVDAARAGETARRAGRAGWTSVTIHQDLYGRERYLLAQRSEGP